MNIFLNPYLAVAIYPILAYLLGDPGGYAWGWNHPGEPMPRKLELRVQRNGRLFWIVRYAILASYVLYAMHGTAIRKGTPIQSFFLGIVVGAVLIQLRCLVIKWWPGLSFENAAHPMTEGPIGVWATVIVVAGFAEELWRAFCLVALRRSGSNVAFAIVCTSVVFALSQLAGRPSRISSQREEIIFTVLVGACLAQLLLIFHSLTMVMSANITYHSLAFYRLRRRTYPEPDGPSLSRLEPTEL